MNVLIPVSEAISPKTTGSRKYVFAKTAGYSEGTLSLSEHYQRQLYRIVIIVHLINSK